MTDHFRGSSANQPVLPASGALLHHVALGAQDPERVAAFYRELFGLEELARHGDDSGHLRSIWLDVGGVTLMVERTHLGSCKVEGVGSGPFLLAFRVKASERQGKEQELAQMGGSVESRTAFTSYCRDPEGNRVAFSHHPESGD